MACKETGEEIVRHTRATSTGAFWYCTFQFIRLRKDYSSQKQQYRQLDQHHDISCFLAATVLPTASRANDDLTVSSH